MYRDRQCALSNLSSFFTNPRRGVGTAVSLCVAAVLAACNAPQPSPAKTEDTTDVALKVGASSTELTPHEAYYIEKLPGLSFEPNFNQYAGLLSADRASDTRLFFWLVESQEESEESEESVDKPLVVWLNGGAGCSSLVGLFLENGPFRMTPTGEIVKNPDARQRVGGPGDSVCGNAGFCIRPGIDRHLRA